MTRASRGDRIKRQGSWLKRGQYQYSRIYAHPYRILSYLKESCLVLSGEAICARKLAVGHESWCCAVTLGEGGFAEVPSRYYVGGSGVEGISSNII